MNKYNDFFKITIISKNKTSTLLSIATKVSKNDICDVFSLMLTLKF
jgi:hypothetical protein